MPRQFRSRDARVAIAVCAVLVAGACTANAPVPPPPTTIVVVESPAPPSATPSAESDADFFARVRSGVVRIQTEFCDASGSGTGFFVSDRYVATVAHVVDGATSVSVRGDNGVVRGTVVGLDTQRDVALVRIEPTRNGQLNSGYVFPFAEAPARVGDRIVVLGYQGGEPLSRKSGSITGVDRTLETETTIRGVLMHDALVSSGNSGSPLLNPSGAVVGIHDAGDAYLIRDTQGAARRVDVAGQKYALTTSQIKPSIQGWATNPRPIPAAACTDAGTADLVTMKSVHPEAGTLAQRFEGYYTWLNIAAAATSPAEEAEAYEHAWEYLGPAARQAYKSIAGFAEKKRGTTIQDVIFETAGFVDPSRDTADLRLTTRQIDPSTGISRCSRLHLRYALSLDSGYWRIESSTDIDPAQGCPGSP